jgi:hypothetical protein
VCPKAGLDGCGKSRPHRDLIPGPSSPYTLLRYISFQKYEQAHFFLFSYDGLCPLDPSYYTMNHKANNAFLYLCKLYPLRTLSYIYIYMYVYICIYRIFIVLYTFKIHGKKQEHCMLTNLFHATENITLFLPACVSTFSQ